MPKTKQKDDIENHENAWSSWRKDDDDNDDQKSKTKHRSRGLDPRKFHQSVDKPGKEIVTQTIAVTTQRKISEVIQDQELRRSAFKDETVLQAWYTQDQAFRRFNELEQEFLGTIKDSKNNNHDNDDEEGVQQQSAAIPAAQEVAASMSSSAASQTATKENEAKRQQTARKTSPAKSTQRSKYQEEFRQEKIRKGPLPLDLSCQRALWSMEPRIWSIEKSSSGKRKYIVGQTGRLMDRYWRKTDRDSRHYYELIPAGQACRLYLDLEFSKVSNPDINCTEEILQELWQDLSNELQSVYPDQVKRPLRRSDVVDLDATTDTKFSRHWIVHLPGAHLFRDTACMGLFVQNWIGRLAEEQATRQLAATFPLLQKHFFVNPAPSKATNAAAAAARTRPSCIVDLGVYTRNRLFRLLGSTKVGKSATSAMLRIADTNEFPFPAGFGNHLFYEPAMAAASPITVNNGVNDIDTAVEGFKAATDWTTHAEALAMTLVIPLNVTKMEFPILPVSKDDGDEPGRDPTFNKGQRSQHAGPLLYSPNATMTGPSCYPILDKFVHKELATRGGTQGSIRAWSIEKDEDERPVSITYQMSRNRWCECVQRAHKSNNIFWVVDLVLWHCVQRCHDPECRAASFRGVPVPLPREIRDAVQQELIDQELARLDEAELLNDISKATSSVLSLDAQKEDADFEAALMALNLGPPDEKPNQSQPPNEIEPANTKSSEENNTAGDVADISETALLEAMMTSPELFP